jgi:glycosyltransferase involved in cell wall biosynthesis
MVLKDKKRMLLLTDGNIDNASARIRAIQYIPYLHQNNIEVSLIPRIPEKSSKIIWRFCFFPLLKRWYYIKRSYAISFQRWDIVFIQRIFIEEKHLKLLRNRNTVIFYDFDDAIYINQRKPQNKAKTATMIKNSDEVIVSTEYLKEFCFENHQDPVIIPSPVETDRITPSVKSVDHIPTIGWIGSAWTTGFLGIIESPLKRLAKSHSFRFLTIGSKSDYHIDGINHISKPWSFNEENEGIGEMDIGIMPLSDTDFARSKGGYKLIQYMSGGIPCIASPVGINTSMIRPGVNGYLASTENEWVESLEKLLDDPSLRSQLGSNGRKDAIELYSREVCFEKLMSILRRHDIVNNNQIN